MTQDEYCSRAFSVLFQALAFPFFLPNIFSSHFIHPKGLVCLFIWWFSLEGFFFRGRGARLFSWLSFCFISFLLSLSTFFFPSFCFFLEVFQIIFLYFLTWGNSDYLKFSTLVRVFRMSKLSTPIFLYPLCHWSTLWPKSFLTALSSSHRELLPYPTGQSYARGVITCRPHCPHLKYCSPLCSNDIRRKREQQRAGEHDGQIK